MLYKNICPALLCQYDATSQLFKEIQDFERPGGTLVLLLLCRRWYGDERSSSGARPTHTRDVCLCSASIRMSHATRSYASTLHVPDPRRSRGGYGRRGSPATARRGCQAQTGAARGH